MQTNYPTPIPGPAGTNGTAGKSAYQSWLDDGNTGTEAQFVETFTGQYTTVCYVCPSTGVNAQARRGSPHRPWSTIAAAQAAATGGDLIYLLPGTYSEDITLLSSVIYFASYGAVLADCEFTCPSSTRWYGHADITVTVVKNCFYLGTDIDNCDIEVRDVTNTVTATTNSSPFRVVTTSNTVAVTNKFKMRNGTSAVSPFVACSGRISGGSTRCDVIFEFNDIENEYAVTTGGFTGSCIAGNFNVEFDLDGRTAHANACSAVSLGNGTSSAYIQKTVIRRGQYTNNAGTYGAVSFNSQASLERRLYVYPGVLLGGNGRNGLGVESAPANVKLYAYPVAMIQGGITGITSLTVTEESGTAATFTE